MVSERFLSPEVLSGERARLEEQYDNPRHLEIEGHALDIYDVAPEVLKTETPAILVPGVGATAEMMKENIIGLAELGRRVIVGSSAHGIPAERYGLAPDVEYRKGAAIMRTLRELDIPHVDVVGHSEASMILALASLDNSDRFRNLVFVNPSGWHGPDSPLALAVRSLLEVGRQTKKELGKIAQTGKLIPDTESERVMNVLRVTMKSIFENPASIAKSIEAGGRFDVDYIYKALHDSGHGISIIHGVDDEMLPMRRLQQYVDSKTIDGFYSVRGGHTDIFTNPEKFNVAIDQALDTLANKYAD